MENKKCKNCSNFPCERKECDIFSETACEIFESTVQNTMKLIRHEGLIWKFERVD